MRGRPGITGSALLDILITVGLGAIAWTLAYWLAPGSEPWPIQVAAFIVVGILGIVGWALVADVVVAAAVQFVGPRVHPWQMALVAGLVTFVLYAGPLVILGAEATKTIVGAGVPAVVAGLVGRGLGRDALQAHA